LGDSAAALTALERSQRESGPIWTNYISVGDPTFDLIRGSPRFAALLREAHLENASLTTVSGARR
jgi:hypothetical protein